MGIGGSIASVVLKLAGGDKAGNEWLHESVR